MNDVESDYSDYRSAQDSEGGLHSGHTSPSRRLLINLAVVLGLLVAAVVALALIPGW